MATNDEVIEKKQNDHVEDVGVTKEAKIAAQTEHETTLWQALQSNKKAALWSAVISLTIIMEGYDVGMSPLFRSTTSSNILLIQDV